MRVVITGGTGLIGRALVNSLAADGHEVVILSRSPGNAVRLLHGVEAVFWDGHSGAGWADRVDGAGAVVNLAGESIGGSGFFDVRWTPGRKKRIYESRIQAGQAVVEAIKAAKNRPGVLVQASAVGYYGTETGDTDVTESADPASDYLAEICVAWERSTAPVEKLGVRRVILRTGVVLSTRGGALPRQMLPFKFFAGGPVGSGRQWYPWIHIADQVAAIRFLMANEEAKGAFNLSAPNPLTNAEFGKAIGRAIGRPSFLPVPAAAFRLLFGEASVILLEGQKAVPRRLLDLGFQFQFPEAEAAIRDLVETKR